ncbi:hypothetical protein NLI96_g4418 [Meripilus lineatus]|uniref:BTB domain-containing protein n=1 Tax=Meripilus lineatus TaxID=2056292 RepID=A0AAD5V520_9APHY|nr:hypothetical protein NLI96_g4418 [Physisporinus lineatus]
MSLTPGDYDADNIRGSDADVKKHPTLYFDNGDIIVICPFREKDKGYQHFRVDQIFLSRHSPIFKTTVSLPTGPGPSQEDSMEGVSVMRVPDDAEDMEGFLKAMYEPSSLFFKRFSPETSLRMKGTLKLATKYEARSIRDALICVLKEDWWTTYKEWELRQDYQDRQVAHGHKNLDEILPEPASCYRLAVEFNIPSIRFSTLYALACVPWAGNDRGTVRKKRQPAKDVEQGKHITVNWDLLDRDDLFKVGKARQILARKIVALPQEMKDQRHPAYFHRTPGPCQAIWEGLDTRKGSRCVVTEEPDLLLEWRAVHAELSKLCSDCMTPLDNYWNKLWAQLEGDFDKILRG